MPNSKKIHAMAIGSTGLLSSPAVVFSAAWISCAALTALAITDLFSTYAQSAGAIALALIVSHLAGATFAGSLPPPSPRRPQPFHDAPKFETGLFAIWALISAIELVHSRGIPIVWLKSSPERTYADFGIHSLHGAANGIWLYMSTAIWIRIMGRRARHGDWTKALILTAWPILLLSRALLTISLAVVLSYAAVSSKKSASKKLVLAVAFAALFVWGFGLLGDVRSSEFSISSALGLQDTNWPAGILWVYAYTVSPIANLALNVSSGLPSYELLPINTLSPLLPSQVRQSMGVDVGFNGYLGDLVHGAFNVSTAFNAPYYDWGWPGMMLMSLLLGAAGQRIWATARVTREVSLLAVFNALIALSVFTNQFNQLPVILFFILVRTFPFSTPAARNRRSPRVAV
jgi:oligosaccharide repeat unit polymerase